MFSKATKLRFTTLDDLILLREVLGYNPFENGWTEVHQNVVKSSAKNFSLRAIREHTEHLIKLFKRNDRANLRKSGTEEQYEEKEQLLQQLIDMQREFSFRNKQKRDVYAKQDIMEIDFTSTQASCSYNYLHNSEENFDTEIYTEIRQNPEVIKQEESQFFPVIDHVETENISNSTTISKENNNISSFSCKSVNNQLIKNSSLQFLRERKELDYKIKQRELDLEEKKLALEEKRITLEERKICLEEAKYELEKEERAKRLKMELEERSHRIFLEKQQNDIHCILVKHLINK